MARLHTLAIVAACSSGPAGSKNVPPEPPPTGPTQIARPAEPEPPEPAQPPPAPPILPCTGDTAAVPARAPEPTWFCAREDGTRDGRFVTLFPDRSLEIEGTYADGMLEGEWLRHDEVTGAVVERGTYAGGRKHGTWTQYDPQGVRLGDYEMIAGTGVERQWYDDGALYSEVGYTAGMLDGIVRRFLPDGTLIESARHTFGKLDGPHEFGTRDTLRIEETVVDGVPRGERKIYQFNLLVAEDKRDVLGRFTGPYVLWRSRKIARVKGQYASGRRVGDWVWLDRDGKIEREGTYAGGKRVGTWKEYWKEKLVWTGTYASGGRPDGTFTYWTRRGDELGSYEIANGTGWELTFFGNRRPATKQWLVRGVEHGTFQQLTPIGRVVVQGRFDDGLKHGLWKKWTDAGAPVLEEPYRHGKLEGVVKKYVDGKLAMQATYADGRAEGAYAEFRAGKPAVTGQFADDQRTGTWTHYDAAGNVVRTATYKDGILDGPWRELAGGVLLEGSMVAGRRSGTWLRTDTAGTVRKLTYSSP